MTLARTEHPLALVVEPTPSDLGRRAGSHAGRVIADAISANGRARVMLAAAPSQQETLASLAAASGIDWSKVELFHMDDYLGLAADSPQGFANWLRANFLKKVPAADFHPMRPNDEPETEATRYDCLMGDEPFDLVLLGFGVNGHLAFNDPPADLDDPHGVRVVDLDSASRQQQVDEGHFSSVADVPARAITVTIPRLLNSVVVIASVPGEAKRQAVINSLSEPIGPLHPGTALRTHPDATLYVDAASDPR
jgi:glucosamine-6-phosphate deaminase